MGKSWLMADLAAATGLPLFRGAKGPELSGGAIWDLPPGAEGAALPDGTGPLYIAKRPETPVAGLARAEIYGQVLRFGSDALLFGDVDIGAALARRTGGWPCLLPAVRADLGPGPLLAFLRDDLLTGLASEKLVALALLLRDPAAAVPPEMRSGLPFFSDNVEGEVPGPLAACGPALVDAVTQRIDSLRQTAEGAANVAQAQAALGLMPEAIATLQQAGDFGGAMRVLVASESDFMIHSHGPQALEGILAGFPPEMLAQEEPLVLCRAIHAVKHGDVALARQVLIARYGPDMSDVHKVILARGSYSFPLRCFRFLLCTWESEDLPANVIADSFSLLTETPVQDDLRRGAFYNAVLELYIRERRFAEADHVAGRAEWHYARVAIPILSFYVDLHRAMIQLFLGDPQAAGRYAGRAAEQMARVRFDSPGDKRLLQLLAACIAYESGDAAPLVQFLSQDLDDFARGEIWPTLVETMLIYGSQALSEHVSAMAARTFLDRWRVAQVQGSRFKVLIDIREVLVLQNANRWQEAAQKAAGLSDRITLERVGNSQVDLVALSDRDDLALALCWLRHFARMEPLREGLDGQLGAMLQNPHLTARQRTGGEIWLAHVLRRQRRHEESMALLGTSLGAAAALGAIAILGEERVFLADLTSTRRVRDVLDRTDAIRRVLRQVQDAGPGRIRRGRQHGLTRQEMRILYGIAEGSTNKAIAKLIGLSEATVKFHLSNLYRKLACHSRHEAVKAARALQILG